MNDVIFAVTGIGDTQFVVPAALTAAYAGYLGWDWWKQRKPRASELPPGISESSDVLASLTQLLIDIDDHRNPEQVVAAVRACMDVVDTPSVVVETKAEATVDAAS